jgi:hypothetical protein
MRCRIRSMFSDSLYVGMTTRGRTLGIVGDGPLQRGPLGGGPPRERRALYGVGAPADLPHHHLEGATHRDPDEGTHERAQVGPDPAPQGGPDQDGQQDPEGVEPHRPAHDDRVEDVVLHLLVDQEDDQHDDAGRDRVDGGDDHHRDAGQQASDQREQVDQGHEDAQQEGEGDAEDGQGDPHDDAGDHRGQEVAQHVAGHRADRLVDHPVRRTEVDGRNRLRNPAPQPRRLQHGEEGQHGDGADGDQRRDRRRADREGGGRLEHLGQLLGDVAEPSDRYFCRWSR